ncbi:major facilitator superfamily domain-containing protein [Mycena sp. CBHHK59/15]|nr:major facilitator superfamily domain-containing protein [Mycena sp. CBHHK59/15]
MAPTTENTPLLGRGLVSANLKRKGLFSPYRRVLAATFLLSTTFWFTATPLIYAYRVFNCQEYYEDPLHPPYEGTGDACAITAVETSTAKDISVTVILSTFSGTANLLFTTWQIRHWGLRAAIVQQTFWPALRNLTQIYATFVGHRLGITIMQSTQLITILGGGAGYMLSANSYIAEVVEPEERTASFGILAGMSMLGTAVGYMVGGLANDYIGISAPFEITFCLLVGSTLFTAFLLPYIPPAVQQPSPETPVSGTASSASSTLVAEEQEEPEKKPESLFSFLNCLQVFLPAKYAHRSGTFWGLTLIGVGAFGGVLATAYVPLMLQLTATNQYGYKPADNGFLMSTNALSRAVFLTFIFPQIISHGRKWFSPSPAAASPISPGTPPPKCTPNTAGLPVEASAFEPSPLTSADGAPEDPVNLADAMPATDTNHGSKFDLAFLRWSMVVDACLTGLVGFSSQSWHMMAAAAILPLASGTAPACKGVLMDMVPDHRRSDALAAISLVETLALISTVSLFGAVFAFLSEIGHPNVVFFCNALTAVLAATILFAVRFPKGPLRGP